MKKKLEKIKLYFFYFLVLRRLKKNIKTLNKKIIADFGGGSSLTKVSIMASLIYYFRLNNTVDIGVYRGRSFFPQIIAHKHKKKGFVFGVDPYTNTDAIQHDRKDIADELSKFASNTDFESIYNNVNRMINEYNFDNYGKLIRMPSNEASKYFKEKNIEFDLIHIDGNHDTEFVMQDVKNYTPLLSAKSIVVLDDISWDSVKPAYEYLSENLLLLYKKSLKEDDFAVFVKGFSDNDFAKARMICHF